MGALREVEPWNGGALGPGIFERDGQRIEGLLPVRPLELAGVAIALGFDAFSVALGVGACWTDWRSRFRMSWHFGLFQSIMSLLGWQIGAQIIVYIEAWDHWFVFGVLMGIALKMLYESLRHGSRSDQPASCNPTKGWMLIGLSLAVSVDALGVGLTFGSLERHQVPYILVIGLTAIAMTASGMLLGSMASSRLGAWAERVGAGILGAVAVKLLLA
ncbi:MAG: manganese efflux pump MntP [Candidatus Zipacnadales bacterium]